MPPKITEVQWGYSGRLPNGISFKEETGTFSGTPTKVGEYTIPVTVWTNYGEDTKDVKIRVRTQGHEVYAVGNNYAKIWSGNTEPDEDGFYKLNIPKAVNLRELNGGFAAETEMGNWYICGERDYGVATNGQTQPVQVPFENIIDIASSSASNGSNPTYIVTLYLFSDNTCGKVDTNSDIYGRTSDTSALTAIIPNVIKINSNGKVGYSKAIDGISKARLLFEGNKVGGDSVQSEQYAVDVGLSDKIIKTFLPREDISYFVTNNGELWRYTHYQNTPTLSQVDFPYGTVKDAYTTAGNGCLSVATTGGELYAMGGNYNYQLGLPEAKNYTDLTKVGDYDVKKMSYLFMLTESGELYYSGQNGISGIVNGTQGYTRIFPNKKFKDIAFADGGLYHAKVLIATIEE